MDSDVHAAAASSEHPNHTPVCSMQAFTDILRHKQRESCPLQQTTLEALTALLGDSSPEVQQLAAQVMVACTKPYCVRNILDAGALLPLLQLMSRPSTDDSIASTAKIAFLMIIISSEDGEHVGTVTTAVSELARQLELPLPADKQKAILSVISYISVVAGPRYAPAVAPAVPQIVTLLCEGISRIPTAAAQTLAAIGACATGADPAAATSDALVALVQLLRLPEPDSQQAAADAISQHAVTAEQKQLLEELHAPSTLVQMLHQTHPGFEDAAASRAQIAAANALTTLAEHISNSIVMGEAMAALTKLIACPTRGFAARVALRELILRSGTPAAIQCEQALQALVLLLCGGTREEKDAAAEAFWLIGSGGGAQLLGGELGRC